MSYAETRGPLDRIKPWPTWTLHAAFIAVWAPAFWLLRPWMGAELCRIFDFMAGSCLFAMHLAISGIAYLAE